MSTIRVASRRRFTSVDRTTINDPRLSFRALGLLTWLLDKPDDWQFDSTSLGGSEGREGRDALRSAMKELRECGYARYTRVQGARGLWSTEIMIYETPEASPELAVTSPLVEAAGVGDGPADEPCPTPENPSSDRRLESRHRSEPSPTPGKPTVGFPGAKRQKHFVTENDDYERTLPDTSTVAAPNAPKSSSSSGIDRVTALVELAVEAQYQAAPNLVKAKRPWQAAARLAMALERADDLAALAVAPVSDLDAVQALTDLPRPTVIAAARALGRTVPDSELVHERPATVHSLEARQARSHVAGLCLTGAIDEARDWIANDCPAVAQDAARAELARHTNSTRSTA